MENATKALLIAAAILVVILLIAFGMRIMNQTGNAAKAGSDMGGTLSAQSNAAGTNAALSVNGLTTSIINN